MRRLHVSLEDAKDEPEIEITAHSTSALSSLHPDLEGFEWGAGVEPILLCPYCKTEVFPLDFDAGKDLNCELCGYHGELSTFNVPFN